MAGPARVREVRTMLLVTVGAGLLVGTALLPVVAPSTAGFAAFVGLPAAVLLSLAAPMALIGRRGRVLVGIATMLGSVLVVAFSFGGVSPLGDTFRELFGQRVRCAVVQDDYRPGNGGASGTETVDVRCPSGPMTFVVHGAVRIDDGQGVQVLMGPGIVASGLESKQLDSEARITGLVAFFLLVVGIGYTAVRGDRQAITTMGPDPDD